jgi:serine protease Do
MNVTKEFKSAVITLAASVIAGALAGAIAGWTTAQMPSAPYDRALAAESQAGATSTLPEPEVEVVSVDRKPLEPLVPPAFADRRSSSVAAIYRRTAGADVLSEDFLLGQAVAVTSDGWFVTPAASVDGLALGDMVLWHDGVAAPVERGIMDERASVVFLKTNLENLTAPGFAKYEDVTSGLAVWIERRAGSFEPMSVFALGVETGEIRAVSSRTAARRPSLSGAAFSGDLGAPVWGNGGSLIGLISSAPGQRIAYIPASAWAPSLFGIFSEGAVKHADLGVLSADLTAVRLVERDPALPERGAWIVPDKQKGIAAVAEDSPADAAGVLPGDVIQRVDRDMLDGSADLGEVLVQYKPGSRVTLTIVRNGETLELPVTLGSEPVSREME